jgi:hypothetical protein
MEEKDISNSLKRYYNDRIKINEKQKLYFRTIYYWKHRQRLLDYQRMKRQELYKNQPTYLIPINYNKHDIKHREVSINKNCRVSF